MKSHSLHEWMCKRRLEFCVKPKVITVHTVEKPYHACFRSSVASCFCSVSLPKLMFWMAIKVFQFQFLYLFLVMLFTAAVHHVAQQRSQGHVLLKAVCYYKKRKAVRIHFGLHRHNISGKFSYFNRF